MHASLFRCARASVCNGWRVAVSSFAGAYVCPVDGRSECADAIPLWARCNGELDQGYTLGVAEELLLLQPDHWSLAQSSDGVPARLSDELSPQTSPETHAAVLELAASVHADVGGWWENSPACEAGSRASWTRWD